AIAGLIWFPIPRPMWLNEYVVAYFGVLTLYVTVAFTRAARSQLRITARRMRLIAAGSGCLTVAILLAGLRTAFPMFEVPFTVLGGPFGLLSGLAFYFGFTTPGWLRLSWYAPELSAFANRADRLAE